jgi:hypothetical protein
MLIITQDTREHNAQLVDISGMSIEFRPAGIESEIVALDGGGDGMLLWTGDQKVGRRIWLHLNVKQVLRDKQQKRDSESYPSDLIA